METFAAFDRRSVVETRHEDQRVLRTVLHADAEIGDLHNRGTRLRLLGSSAGAARLRERCPLRAPRSRPDLFRLDPRLSTGRGHATECGPAVIGSRRLVPSPGGTVLKMIVLYRTERWHQLVWFDSHRPLAERP